MARLPKYQTPCEGDACSPPLQIHLAAIIALPTSLATAQAPTIIVGGIPYTSKPTAMGPSMKSLWTVPRSGVRPRLYRRSEKQIKDILFRDVDGTHENG